MVKLQRAILHPDKYPSDLIQSLIGTMEAIISEGESSLPAVLRKKGCSYIENYTLPDHIPPGMRGIMIMPFEGL